MASSSSVPPSNPFDGFDSYSTVAAPAMTATTQQQPQYPQQPQQPQQQPSSPTPQMHQEWQRPVAAMASPYYAAQMLPMPGMSPQPQQQPQPVQPQQQQQQQELVPAAPSAMSPWALSPNPPPSAGQLTASNAFPRQQQHQIPMDPFAVQLPMQQQQQLVPQPQYQQQLLSPQYQIPPPQLPPQQQQQSTTPQQRLHNELQGFFNDETPQNKPSVLPDETEEEGLGLIDVELDDDENNTSNNNHTNNERRKADGEFFGKHQHHHQHSSSSSPLRDKYADIAPPPPITPARHHAEYLAQQTTRTPSSGSITSPLPQPSLVLHSGYVLSRISFRTVLLRKWKQTFWIQYGPTQLLFFRSFADCEDWLNNPYHSQRARDFLIKLRVDFVSDLKKTSVMGYQVTQIRRKPYGKNVMLHFKLERWMDYGPTIAAAFAAREEEMVHSPTHRSNTNRRGGGGGGGGGNDNDDDDDGDNFMNTTNDVASLRKIILGCMRNARDAALVASRGGYGGGSGEAEDMYRGRYNNDGGDYHNNSAASAGVGGIMNDRSGTVNMGYHQAFSAESTPRRRMDMDEIKENNNSSSAEKSSVKTEESAEATTTMAPPAAITNGVVDLLG